MENEVLYETNKDTEKTLTTGDRNFLDKQSTDYNCLQDNR